MKKLFTISALLVLSTATFASDAAFTLAEAAKYCPTPNTITFSAYSTAPYSAGVFEGNNSLGQNFTSWNVNRQSTKVSAPKSLSTIIRRNIATSGEDYGFISGNNITCYYRYKLKITGDDSLLNMDTAHARPT